MKKVTLIIHGYSDCSESFVKIKKFLQKKKIGTVKTILYADYESREDNMTFNDVIDGLNDELIKNKIIDQNGKKLCDLNVIVHSTGGLVIRHWIWRYYYKDGNRINECPVRRLIMLAPANFGSPLAHRGKSFLGHIFKGRWKIGDFLEVGKRLLYGLELGSPYQWNLAHRDIIIKKPYYNSTQIQTTILVGIDDYEGLRGWVNKPGTDGTVVIAGTSLDSAKLVLDFSKPRDKRLNYKPYNWTITNPSDDFAFGVLEGLDHGSIEKSEVGELLVKALKIKDKNGFKKYSKDLKVITQETYKNSGKSKYQQFIIHAVDDHGVSVKDYTIEFFISKVSRSILGNILNKIRFSIQEKELTKEANKIMTGQFHTHTKDSSYRRFLVNLEEIKSHLKKAQNELKSEVILSMRVYVPRVDKGIKYELKTLQNIVIYDPNQKRTNLPLFFWSNTTTLIELRVNRINEYVTVGIKPKNH